MVSPDGMRTSQGCPRARVAAGLILAAGLLGIVGSGTSLAQTPPASPQRVVVLRAPADQGGAALDVALLDALATMGMQDAGPGAQALPECGGGACAGALLRTHHAAQALRATRVHSELRALDAVEVSMTGADGLRFVGRGACPRGSIDLCVRRALRDARGLRLLGPGPWLQVEGDPAGAEVSVDGVFVGQLPYRGRVSPGRRRVDVRAAGYGAQRYRLRVPPDAVRPLRLAVALPIVGLDAMPVPAPVGSVQAAAAAKDGPLLGPMLLGVAGVGVAAYALAAMATARDCDGGCGATPSAAVGVTLVSAGAVAVAGAALWYELGRRRGDAQAARVTLCPVGVRGRF